MTRVIAYTVLALSTLTTAARVEAQPLNGTLTWTHARPATLTGYRLSVDGAPEIDLGLPATNATPLTLETGPHSLVLSACYSSGTCKPLTATVTAAPSNAGAYVDCEVDSSTRVLPTQITGISGMTPEKCVTAVAARGLNYAGVEAGNECWGGNTKGTQVVADSLCSTNCVGDPTKKCGAGWKLSVYQAR